MKHVICIVAVLFGTVRASAGDSTPSAAPPAQDCVVVDMWGHLDDTTKSIQEMSLQIFGAAHDPAWLKNVRICRAGKYSIWMPADGGSNHILMYRDDGQAIMVDGGDVWIFDKNKRMVASMKDDDLDGAFDFVDYYLKPTAPDGTGEIWDRDADGCPDWRFVKDADGSEHRLVNLAGRWCELKKQGSKYGFVVDGKFYPTQRAKGVAIEKSLNECAKARAGAAN